MRGDAHLERKDWPQCTADFVAADAYTQRDHETPPMSELHRKLRLCEAHAGKLGDAENTFTETVASGSRLAARDAHHAPARQ